MFGKINTARGNSQQKSASWVQSGELLFLFISSLFVFFCFFWGGGGLLGVGTLGTHQTPVPGRTPIFAHSRHNPLYTPPPRTWAPWW